MEPAGRLIGGFVCKKETQGLPRMFPEISALEYGEVLRKIMDYLSDSELVKLSYVNKMFKLESRCLLRERAKLLARVNLHSHSQDLVGLASILQKMDIDFVPFSGLDVHCLMETPSHVRVDSSLAVLFEKIPWRNFSWTMKGYWRECNNCAGFMLGRIVLQEFGAVLETLTLNIECYREFFIKKFHKCRFPKLKVLKLESMDESSDESYREDIMTLLNCAPNLQILYTEVRLDLIETILEGRLAKMQQYPDDEMLYNVAHIQFPENVTSKVRFERVMLNNRQDDFNLPKFNRTIPMLLQTSATTLTTIWMDVEFAILLMIYDIPSDNLEKLTINIDIRNPGLASVLKIIKYFDFSRLFPKLTKVFLSNENESGRGFHESINDLVETWNGNSNRIWVHHANSIKHLEFEDASVLTDLTAKSFSKIFNEIHELTVYSCQRPIPYDLIWKNWPTLKQLSALP